MPAKNGLPPMLMMERWLERFKKRRKPRGAASTGGIGTLGAIIGHTAKQAATKRKRNKQKRGGYVGLAKAALTYGLPEIYNMVRSGVGSQNGNSAGSRASYMRFGLPLTKRYR